MAKTVGKTTAILISIGEMYFHEGRRMKIIHMEDMLHQSTRWSGPKTLMNYVKSLKILSGQGYIIIMFSFDCMGELSEINCVCFVYCILEGEE
jgi:hypothetical protein